MSIKYYQLAKDEEPPDEFCAVRDIGGEPSEYVFYVPESENAKLRELVRVAYNCTNAGPSCLECRIVAGGCTLLSAMRELGVRVD